jgi:hypothetical protein
MQQCHLSHARLVPAMPTGLTCRRWRAPSDGSRPKNASFTDRVTGDAQVGWIVGLPLGTRGWVVISGFCAGRKPDITLRRLGGARTGAGGASAEENPERLLTQRGFDPSRPPEGAASLLPFRCPWRGRTLGGLAGS